MCSSDLITVANQKGGVGKTTSAVNLASAMALAGLRVLVIDLDPQGNASTAFGVDHHEDAVGSYDVLVEQRPIADVMVAAPGYESLWVLPASLDLAGADIELITSVSDEERPFRLREALDDFLADHEMDYVFVDCPPSLGMLTVNALAAASSVLVPMQCEFFALEGLSQLLSTVEQVRKTLNPLLTIHGVVLTMFDPRNNLASQVVADVRSYMGEKVYETIIPRNVRVSEAPSHGKPVLLYDLKCAGSQAYLKLASEIIQREHKLKAA